MVWIRQIQIHMDLGLGQDGPRPRCAGLDQAQMHLGRQMRLGLVQMYLGLTQGPNLAKDQIGAWASFQGHCWTTARL